MIFFALLACFGGSEQEFEQAEASARPDIVFITLDTTRADRLGCYGHEGAETPVIDALCNSGRRYERAYSPAPLTIPSHAAMFSGIHPARLGIRNNGDGKLQDSVTTLTEVLAENGYQTAAAVSAFVTSRTWGFAQGFQQFFDDMGEQGSTSVWSMERRGGETVDDLLAWAKDRDTTVPAFAWLHLFDPHFPYSPPSEYWDVWNKRPYDGELAYVDDQLARVVAEFDPEKTLYIIASDHGEGLGDHNELTHGLFVYDSTQRVPFIVSGPGVAAGVVEEPVGLIDLMPTVLDVLGLAAPEGIDGQVMPGNPARPLYMESWALMRRFGFSPHLAVIDGPNKWIATTRPELYDLLSDPGEQTLLEDPQRSSELEALLGAFDYPQPSMSRLSQDPAAAMRLEALGYVEGNFVGELQGILPDPKDEQEAIVHSQWAEHHGRKGELKKAEDLLRKLIVQYPDALEFSSRLASILSRQNRKDEAISILKQAAVRAPDDPSIMASLGVHNARSGRYKEATALFQSAADALPWAPGLRAMAVASQLSAPGGEEEAVRMGLAYLRNFPDDHAVAGLLGVAFAKAEVPEARVLLEAGLKASQPEREVAYLLGVALMKQGKSKRARRLFERELQHYPKQTKAAQALVTLHDKAGNQAAILQVASEALLHQSKDVFLLHAKSQALFNLKKYALCRTELDLALVHHPRNSSLLLLDANLLSKEGKPEHGAVRFEEAKAAKAAEDAASTQ